MKTNNRIKAILIIFFSLFLIIESRLYQVVSLTRHGARYHMNNFGGGSMTKKNWGELTPVGMKQH